MKKLGIVVLIAVWAFGVGPAVAEEASPPPLDMSHEVHVNLGDIMAFEEAIKDHWQLHADAGDSWSWEVWEKIVGQGAGIYSIRSGNHNWADFDDAAEIEGDRDHVISSLMPNAKCVSTKITKWDFGISRWPDGETPPKMVEVTEFQLHYGTNRAFYNAVKKVHDVIVEKDMDMHYAWGWTVNGGSGPSLMLVTPHDSWADFEQKEPDFWGVVEESLGRTEVQAIQDTFDEALSGSEDAVYVFREDLSYMPMKSE